MEATEWHALRRRSIGASDTPVILGLSPYASACPLALAWGKRGLTPLPTDPPNTLGHHLEPLGLAWLSKQLDCDVHFDSARDEFALYCTLCRALTSWPNPCHTSPEACLLHANLDGRVAYREARATAEIKVISLGNPDYQGWRRGQVPLPVQVQVQQQLLCSGLSQAIVLVFRAPYLQWELRTIQADVDFQHWLGDHLADWWMRHVVDGIDPPPHTPWSSATQRAIYDRHSSEPSGEVELPADLQPFAEEWAEKNAAARASKDRARECRQRLLLAMESFSLGVFPDGSTVRHTRDARGARRIRYTAVR